MLESACLERGDDDVASALPDSQQCGLHPLHDRLLAESVRDDIGAPALLGDDFSRLRLALRVPGATAGARPPRHRTAFGRSK